MGLLDWSVMLITVITVVGYGMWKTSGSNNIKGFLLGDNEAKWWTIGLSVMATQASAITFLSTPGQAYYDGMGFVQFYFALPIALIIICITFIPLFYKLKVYTAYEFLENRFDYKTRALTSILFLMQRGLATGITIYAPALVLSAVMGWHLNLTAVFIGLIAIIYTVSGGTKAVHVTHRLQMIVILIGLFIICAILLNSLLSEFSISDILTVAGASEKLEIIDTQFSWSDRYNIWTCLLAAPFLFLSYFGTDQSQVQRYISGRSIKESRMGLIMNGFLKLPLQFFILFLGVLVFIFLQFNQGPIFFNQSVIAKVEQSEYAKEAKQLNSDYQLNFEDKKRLQLDIIKAYETENTTAYKRDTAQLHQLLSNERIIRSNYKDIIEKVDKRIETNDKDYVFINFILNNVPKGLIGLLFAMILFAAMSSSASELNALASTTTVDIYKPLFAKNAGDHHYLQAGKLWTLFWGAFAILFAAYGTLYENLIQFVNIIGSLFYGTILGIFLVAFYIKKLKGDSVFYAAIVAEIIVIGVHVFYVNTGHLSFLWLVPLGSLLVILLAGMIQSFQAPKNADLSN